MCPSVPPPPVGRKKEPRPPWCVMPCPPYALRVRMRGLWCVLLSKVQRVPVLQVVRVSVFLCVPVCVFVCVSVQVLRVWVWVLSCVSVFERPGTKSGTQSGTKPGTTQQPQKRIGNHPKPNRFFNHKNRHKPQKSATF